MTDSIRNVKIHKEQIWIALHAVNCELVNPFRIRCFFVRVLDVTSIMIVFGQICKFLKVLE